MSLIKRYIISVPISEPCSTPNDIERTLDNAPFVLAFVEVDGYSSMTEYKRNKIKHMESICSPEFNILWSRHLVFIKDCDKFEIFDNIYYYLFLEFPKSTLDITEAVL